MHVLVDENGMMKARSVVGGKGSRESLKFDDSGSEDSEENIRSQKRARKLNTKLIELEAAKVVAAAKVAADVDKLTERAKLNQQLLALLRTTRVETDILMVEVCR